MMNFTFYNPTRIIFGKEQLAEIDCLIPKSDKVMILYGGGSVKKFGTLEQVINKLKFSSRKIIEFGNIEANPRFETLMKAVEIARKEKVDFLLAVGGGSVMDGAKFVALATMAHSYFGKEEELLKFSFGHALVDKALPLGCIVTLSATGSEMNCGCVISKGTSKYVITNPLLFPKFSILDPTLTFTLPPTQIANGVIDAFVHTIEQYLTFPANGMFQDRTAEGILQNLIEIGKKNIDHPHDYDLRANLVWNATMALNGLIGAGVPQDWTTHMIGHELTSHFNIDHAKSLAIILPAVLKIRTPQKREKLIQYAERVWGIHHGSPADKCDIAITKTIEFFESLGVKCKLSDYHIKENAFPQIIQSLEENGLNRLSETADLTLNEVKQILHAAL